MSVTPDFVGQRYKDTNTGNIWIANSTTPGDWTLEVQNMKVEWEPKSSNFPGRVWYSDSDGYGGFDSITSLTFRYSTTDQGINIAPLNLVNLSFPNLVEVDPTATYQATLTVGFASSLTTISIPLLKEVGKDLLVFVCDNLTSIDVGSLETVGNDLEIDENISLQSVNLGSLVTVGNAIRMRLSPLLTSISLGNLIPTNGKNLQFNDNALDVSTVNMILARAVANAGYVSGNIILGGGTNAAPSGQGIVDKATLIGRGVTVTTN